MQYAMIRLLEHNRNYYITIHFSKRSFILTAYIRAINRMSFLDLPLKAVNHAANSSDLQ